MSTIKINGEDLTDKIINEDAENVHAFIKELQDQYGADGDVCAVLYKLDPFTQRNKQVARYKDGFFPDAHDIGIYHGSGDYRVTITYKDPLAKNGRGNTTRTFSLDGNYDELKKEADEKKLRDKLEREKLLIPMPPPPCSHRPI